MGQKDVVVRGARTHNLKNVDVRIPRGSLTTITGVSGSGKSSLAFDTIHNEGQRRFLESLSSYARQFLGQIEKPDVDQIDGLSPTVSIDQKTVNRNPRSTVGTVTEIHDFLRLLFARLGTPSCPDCGLTIKPRTVDEIRDLLLRDRAGHDLMVLAPIVKDRKGEYRKELEDLRLKGYVRARIDGELRRLDEDVKLGRYQRHTIEVVIDRIKASEEKKGRLAEAIEQALDLGDGVVGILDGDDHASFSSRFACIGCGASFPEIEPRSFSFNSPHGACATCGGLGTVMGVDTSRIVPDPDRSLKDGALAPLGSSALRELGGVSKLTLPGILARFGGAMTTPWRELPDRVREVILNGSDGEEVDLEVRYEGRNWKMKSSRKRALTGVVAGMRSSWEDKQPRFLRDHFVTDAVCHACDGARLKKLALSVRFREHTIAALGAMDVDALALFFGELELDAREEAVGRPILKEILARLAFLRAVGLGYLALERGAATLSGGESQRIRLATQVGAGLKGVLYVLDEPSIGLHARDNRRLIETLESLRDLGNTVCVVEHDQETMERSDRIIDLGPGAGVHGGEVVGEGSVADLMSLKKSPLSKTGAFLAGRRRIAEPLQRRVAGDAFLSVRGASEHNLRDVDARFPVGLFTVVTGVSGSGKSTLIDDVLKRALAASFHAAKARPGKHRAIEGLEHFDKVIEIDQSPIGRTPRSNPATYVKLFDLVRDLFARLPESEARGYGKGRFSFNVAGGRCEVCQGAGVQVISMQFLPDVEVTCEACNGHRFNPETLEIAWRGKNVAEVLDMTIEEAGEFFGNHPKMKRVLDALNSVGLGYVRLGQPATTLSGGEAQRVKLASELRRPATGRTLYLLDEPTTGLHFEDVERLIHALQGLVDAGNTVVVVEHDLDVVRVADWIVDLGPEGGRDGGSVVYQGPWAGILARKDSHTAHALRAALGKKRRPKAHRRRIVDLADKGEIEILGARTHNLKNVDVRIPSGKMTVITGPSGSGKTSLAFDTLFAEGQRRFVESLSSYARQFLGRLEKAPVDRIEGLAPSIAINQKNSSRNPRSTVATTTEIYDYLRLLYARAGTAHCPVCAEPLVAWSPADAWEALSRRAGEKGRLIAPLWSTSLKAPLRLGRPAGLKALAADLKAAGFLRLAIDGEEVRLDAPLPALARVKEIHLVVDRVAIGPTSRQRVLEAIETAWREGRGIAGWLPVEGPPTWFPRERECVVHGTRTERELSPRLFSFNSLVGSCPGCLGVGNVNRCDPELLVNRPGRAVLAGGMDHEVGRFFKRKSYFRKVLRSLGDVHGFAIDAPWNELDDHARTLILDGAEERVPFKHRSKSGGKKASFEMQVQWKGLRRYVEKWYGETDSEGWRAKLAPVMRSDVCGDCNGRRLRAEALAVTVGGLDVSTLTAKTVSDALAFFAGLELDATRAKIAERLVREITERLGFLERVGLQYLTLDRSAATLSGGEAQRIRLATQIGSKLSGVIYVLDEPSIGLHQRDVANLLATLKDLVDLGNTVVVVEHDEETIEAADWIIDIGPGAGHHGGQVMYQGPRADLLQHPESLTAAWLSGHKSVARPAQRRTGDGSEIVLRGVRTNNLKGIDAAFPLAMLTAVTGVSGSGKSSLVVETLVPALERHLGRKPDGVARMRFDAIEGASLIEDMVVIDQAPIGRTPKSNPATYTGAFDLIRAVFATAPVAKLRGYGPGRFSFNAPGGRCEACGGRGSIKVEMSFLADVWIGCEVCRGRRYTDETLAVLYKGKNVADVLEMEAADALEFFVNHRRIRTILQTLVDVGLGYVKLGQPATTLSGGEAQRIKLAKELARRPKGRLLYVLDEPTTGLHFDDVGKLAVVLHRLVDEGHGVVVIEHNLDVISGADRVVDLGPEGGDGGGEIVAVGTPEEIADDPRSWTGRYLAAALGRRAARPKKVRKSEAAKRPKARPRPRKGAADGAA